ncbi:hypothetical protein NAPIS_ORF00745 [Vairimorpha apis BRL 01]|uniref:Uncharacterized protein n=1 Tax=Vairimorpha apis BRL 01 TaxID=1037528 RepID=T0LBD8_9MICR|nr:hypothetical protein NAPIS_ORF00745 [Vairimorpha apis BRL 01]
MNINETGVSVILIGISVFIFGFLLLLDKALMICGNILIFAGIGILVKSNLFNMFHYDKLQGTFVFTLGFLFLVYGFIVLGFIMELIGLFILLKESIPSFRTILRGLLFGRVLKKRR